MKLAGPLAARSPGLRLALAHEIERRELDAALMDAVRREGRRKRPVARKKAQIQESARDSTPVAKKLA